MTNEILYYEYRDQQAEFYSQIYSGCAGWMCFAYRWKEHWEQRLYKYPNEMGAALDFVKYSYEFVDVYHCAHLLMDPTYRRIDPYTGKKSGPRVKENAVALFRTAWADLDEVEPTSSRLRPSIIVETSPDRYQAYWLLDELIRAERIEDINRRIIHDAKGHSNDQSGWPLTKLLRVPWTFNHKAEYERKLGYKPRVVLWP